MKRQKQCNMLQFKYKRRDAIDLVTINMIQLNYKYDPVQFQILFDSIINMIKFNYNMAQVNYKYYSTQL